MKRIRKEDYKGDGVYIDLDIEYIPYQKLIYDTEKYLNRLIDNLKDSEDFNSFLEIFKKIIGKEITK